MYQNLLVIHGNNLNYTFFTLTFFLFLSRAAGSFDVVMIVGALSVGQVPVAVVRDLCEAAKPGDGHPYSYFISNHEIQSTPAFICLSTRWPNLHDNKK